MVEDSIPWLAGTGHGHAYSADEYAALVIETLGGRIGANVGVVPGFENELAVTSTGDNNLTVATGRAISGGGRVYKNGASNPLTSSDPLTGAGTTGRLVVLRDDWTLRTTALAIISSADSVTTIPTPTQIDGVTWEIPIASFQIADQDGAITALTDAREYVDYFMGKDYLTNIGAANRYSFPGYEWSAVTSGSWVVDKMYYVPFYIPRTMTFAALALDVINAAGGGKLARLGLYKARREADGLWPGRLVVDAGTVLVDAIAEVEADISAIELSPGYYFTAVAVDSGTPQLRFPNFTTSGQPLAVIGHRTAIGDLSVTSGLLTGVISPAPVAGGLPDPAPAPVQITGNVVFPMFRDAL